VTTTPLVEDQLAQGFTQVGLLADPLGDNVPRALQSLLDGGNA